MNELVTYEIRIDGKPIPSESSNQINAIDILLNLNETSSAEINLKTEFSDNIDSVFAIGKAVEILAGYDGANKRIFTGKIINQGIDLNMEESVLIILCESDTPFQNANTNPVLTVNYGDNMLEFNATLKQDASTASEGSLQGFVQTQGTSLVSPSNYIEIIGLYPAFKGSNKVYSVHHHISDGLWFSSFDMGA